MIEFSALKTFRMAYNNSLRKLLGIPKYNSARQMFVCLNIPSFDELLRKYVYSFRNRLVTSQICIPIIICSSTVPLHSIIRTWWESVLNTIMCNVM